MKNTITTLLGSALLATGIASAHISPASAFTLGSCNTSNVDGSVQCGVGLTDQDSVSSNKPLTVNVESYFNSNDWSFGGKIGVENGYNGDGEGKLGEWDISSVFQNTWDDVMLVFKSGQGNLMGYLLDDKVTSGDWTSPFSAPNNNVGDVSHISVYYRSGGGEQPPVNSVPEPATLMGLGLVASGMVMARRRKSSQSA